MSDIPKFYANGSVVFAMENEMHITFLIRLL